MGTGSLAGGFSWSKRSHVGYANMAGANLLGHGIAGIIEPDEARLQRSTGPGGTSSP